LLGLLYEDRTPNYLYL